MVHAHFGLTAWPALAVPARVRALTVHGTDVRHPAHAPATRAALPLMDAARRRLAGARRGASGPRPAPSAGAALRRGHRALPAVAARSGRVAARPRPRRVFVLFPPTPRATGEAPRPRARASPSAGRRGAAARRSAASSPSRCRCGSTPPTPCWCPPSTRASAWRCSRRWPATYRCWLRPWGPPACPGRASRGPSAPPFDLAHWRSGAGAAPAQRRSRVDGRARAEPFSCQRDGPPVDARQWRGRQARRPATGPDRRGGWLESAWIR